jgi:hypothetical protein
MDKVAWPVLKEEGEAHVMEFGEVAKGSFVTAPDPD